MSTAQIYIASAGSGKTFTLVQAYLTILFRAAHYGNPNVYRNILAITFTNKACQEMKDRIIDELTAIAKGENSDQLQLLQSELPFIKDFTGLADKILINLLHDFSNFNVQTIDSFFQQIVRSFAKELNLPLNFEIILNKEEALEFAVDELIDQIGKDKATTEWLTEFAFANIADDKSWNFKRNIFSLSKAVFNSSKSFHTGNFKIEELKSVKQQIEKQLASFEQNVNKASKEALQILEQINYPEKGFSSSYLPKYLNKLAKKFVIKDLTPNNSLIAMFNGDKSFYSKAFEKTNAADIQTLEAGTFYAVVEKLRAFIEEHEANYIAYREIYRNIYAMGVLQAINQNIKTYRTENNALFLLDAAKLIQGFINLDYAPFLFEKLGHRIRYLFIDEFQDTSNLQWQNLRPIIENILGSVEKHLHVLMVGDAKQSIYRWRDGDFELLTHKAASSLYPFPIEEKNLKTNYRSLPAVIQFNNQLFEKVKSIAVQGNNAALSEAIQLIYKNQQQELFKNNAEGFVQVDMLEVSKENPWKENAHELLLKSINDYKAQGYKLHDMAILVRTRSDGVELSQILQSEGIEILSEETMLLQYDAMVQLLIAGLYYFAQPNIDLYYCNFILRLAEHHQIGITQASIFQDFKERKLLAKHWQNLHDIQTNAYGNYDLVELLLQLLQIDYSKNLFVAHFRQLVLDFMKNESNNILDFLNYWETNKFKLSVQQRDGTDKIHVMTVHKSKGLEFPVVLMPYAQWNFYKSNTDDLMWVDAPNLHEQMQFPIRAVKNIADTEYADFYFEERKLGWIDNINLMYVAFTRAREVLHLILPQQAPSKSEPLADTVSRVLSIALHDATNVSEEATRITYTFGSLSQLPASKSKTPAYKNNLAKKEQAQTANFHVQYNFQNSEIRIGNLVHKALYYFSNNDAKIAFQKAAQEEHYSADELQKADEYFQQIIHPEGLFAEWQSSALQSWDEQPLFYQQENLRPDKIFRLANKYIIVDYKTGQAESKYATQLKKYVKALAAMDIDLPIEGYILYAESGLERVV